MSPDYDPKCKDCNRLHMALMWARGDLGDLKRKARKARADEGIIDRLAAAKESAIDAEVNFEAHAAEAHPDGFDTEPRKVKDVRRYRGDKVPCPLCGKRTSAKQRRAHTSPAGFPCPGVAVATPTRTVHLTEAPPVVIPERGRPKAAKNTAANGDRKQPSRLDAGSNCEDCGKWLPGERRLCGRCSVRRAS